MRKLIIAAAAIVGTTALSAPASAQYFPQPRGNTYGYDNYGQVRSYQARVNNLRRVVDQMAYQGARGGRFYQLRREVGELQYQVRLWGRNGLNPREARELDYRVARVERMVHGASMGRGYNGYGQRHGYGQGYDNPYDRGYNGYVPDRDRDGRDDRYENDRGYDRD